jgi:hypothetical protein
MKPFIRENLVLDNLWVFLRFSRSFRALRHLQLQAFSLPFYSGRLSLQNKHNYAKRNLIFQKYLPKDFEGELELVSGTNLAETSLSGRPRGRPRPFFSCNVGSKNSNLYNGLRRFQ